MKKVFNLYKSITFWIFEISIYLIILVLSMFAGIVFAPIEEPTTLEWFSAILFIIGGLLAVLPLSFYVVSAFFNQFIIDEKNRIEIKKLIRFKTSSLILECQEIVNYELKLFMCCPKVLTLETKDNKTEINVWLFSKKQVLEFLQEIQNRGGLQGKTLDKTIFKTKKA